MERLSLCILVFSSQIILSTGARAKRLQLTDVCDEFMTCSRDLKGLREKYASDQTSKLAQDVTELCKTTFSTDLEILARLTEKYTNSSDTCIRHTLKTVSKKRLSREKVRFCGQLMKNASALTEESYPLNVMKLENRCQALRQCCDPAGRCEQAAEHSESGRKKAALRAELEIRMADCRHGKTKEAEEVDKAYCPRYLKCQKDLVTLRASCAVRTQMPKPGDEYSWNPVYNELSQPLDVSDFECKVRFSKSYDDLLKRRKQAQDYLDHCVPVANVTREFYEKQLPCNPSALMDQTPSEAPSGDCRMDVFVQNKQCLQLRNCCVQADVCERNAMYGMLADEYLLAVVALKTDMDNCYHQLRKTIR